MTTPNRAAGAGALLVLLAATFGNLMLAPPAAATPMVVYSNDFSATAGPEWSPSTAIHTLPLGEKMLGGPFSGTLTESLTLSGLPTHTETTLTFDLYILQTWDGNGDFNSAFGPDFWSAVVSGGPTLQPTTTFASPGCSGNQSYPDAYPATHPPNTGAAAVGTLGYDSSCFNADSTYHFSFTFPHSASSITFDFSSSGLQSWGDEGWGLDNVQVSVAGDATPPDIAIATPQDGASYSLGSTVLADYACDDGPDGSGVASCDGTVLDGAAVDTSSVGSKDFTVNAADVAGNVSSLTHSYDVIYDFAGFFQPIDNLPTLNAVKAGSSVPVKFSLNGDQGLGILAPGYPRSEAVACDAATEVDGLEETTTSGSSTLSYDATQDQYVYVWDTEKAWAGTCRQLVVRLADGTSHRANFMFK